MDDVVLPSSQAALDFGTDEDLLDRLSARSQNVVFLVGSAVSAPHHPQGLGVPRVDGVIDLIRSELRRPSERERFEAALRADPRNRYQSAFRFLLRTRDQDVVNAVIRQAVLGARIPSSHSSTTALTHLSEASCRALEQDLEGWCIPPAAGALGEILARSTFAERPIVLTSNFDPLIEIAIRRAGGKAYTTALHGDGSLAGVDGPGCLVVHFHGDWFRTDTLHTPTQLGQERPCLAASLAKILQERTLVVLGYSGWDDVFTRSLISVVRGGVAPIRVAWGFHANDSEAVCRASGALINSLRPGVELGRVALYKGIDAHVLLPAYAERLREMHRWKAIELARTLPGCLPSSPQVQSVGGEQSASAEDVDQADRVNSFGQVQAGGEVPFPRPVARVTHPEGDNEIVAGQLRSHERESAGKLQTSNRRRRILSLSMLLTFILAVSAFTWTAIADAPEDAAQNVSESGEGPSISDVLDKVSSSVPADSTWALQVMKALNGVRSPTRSSRPGTKFVFRLKVCPDGNLQVQTKKPTGDNFLDAEIIGSIDNMRVPVPEELAARLEGRCRTIRYDFTWINDGSAFKVF